VLQLTLCCTCVQVTLVITDVEGSTELWEWDYGVMTHAQEVHDSVMRSLIGRWAVTHQVAVLAWQSRESYKGA
jgi:class 3 adenylate cyclase